MFFLWKYKIKRTLIKLITIIETYWTRYIIYIFFFIELKNKIIFRFGGHPLSNIRIISTDFEYDFNTGELRYLTLLIFNDIPDFLRVLIFERWRNCHWMYHINLCAFFSKYTKQQGIYWLIIVLSCEKKSPFN